MSLRLWWALTHSKYLLTSKKVFGERRQESLHNVKLDTMILSGRRDRYSGEILWAFIVYSPDTLPSLSLSLPLFILPRKIISNVYKPDTAYG